MTTKSLSLSSYPDALSKEGYWIWTPFLYMFLFSLKAIPRAPPRAVVLKVRSLISSINFIWKLVGNSNSQAPTQTYRIRNSEWGSATWALTSLPGDADATEVWGPLPEGLAERANTWEEPGPLDGCLEQSCSTNQDQLWTDVREIIPHALYCYLCRAASSN